MEKKISRRSFIKQAGLALGAAVAAVSCAPAPTPTPTPAPPAPTAKPALPTSTPVPPTPTPVPEPVDLMLKGWSFHPELVDENLKRFMQQYPRITTTYEMVAFAEYRTKIIADSIAKSPLDVLYVPEDTLGAWADAGYLAALDGMPGLSELNADMYPFSHQAMVFGGKQYGLPYFGDSFVWAYNEQMIRDAGFSSPPKNLDEVRDQCLAIKKAGIVEFPLGLGLKKQGGQFFHMWAQLYASGGNMFDEEMNPVFHDKDKTLLELVRWWIDAMHTWKILPVDDLERNWGGVRPVMAAGETAMMVLARYDLKILNDPAQSKIAGHAKMALFPGLDRNDVGTAGFTHAQAIHSGTKHPNEAWNLLNYIGGKDAEGNYHTAKMWYESTALGSGYMPVQEDPAIIAMTKLWGDPDLMKTQSSLAKARQGLKEPWFSQWEAAHQELLQKAVLKEISPEEALQQSAAKAIELKKEWA